MTVGKLKQILAGISDDTKVLIPSNPMEGFDGLFLSPCEEDSDLIELGLEDLDGEEIAERELLNNSAPTEKSFVLVPCGFFGERDHSHEMN
jgi:hypothetical protein